MKTKEAIIDQKMNDTNPNLDSQARKDLEIKKAFSKPKLRLLSKIIFLTLTLLLLFLLVFITVKKNSDGHLTTISKSSLQKIIEINELSTVDYTYNAIATKYDENKKAMYHVAYEGTVTAGIDFNKIEIEVNENEKKVVITVPEVEIHNIKVDMGTMEYIFIKDKYETEDVSQEAYKLCKEDLSQKAEKETVLKTTAKENAKSSVKALFAPWIATIDASYTVEIN